MRFLRLMFFMSTLSGFCRNEFFLSKKITVESGAPYRLHPWMSGRRFEEIHSSLTYTTTRYGNEYHTICCGLCWILFAIELVMGKDAPTSPQEEPMNAKGNTVGLLLRLTKALYSTGKFSKKCFILHSTIL